MKLKLLQDWALIHRVEPEEKTAGGIIIPDSAKEKPTEGIVLAIGPGKYEAEKSKEKDKKKEKKFIPTVLKPGQRIIYGKYSAREFDLDGETLTLVREEDVLGMVEEPRSAQGRLSELEKRHEQPVAIKEKTAVMTITAPQSEKKSISPAVKKSSSPGKKVSKKTAPAAKATVKDKKKKSPNAKKTDTGLKKKTVKTIKTKSSARKPAAKKATTKRIKKAVSPKKVKVPEKKAAVGKTAPVKKVRKITASPKKKTVLKKTAVKTVKKIALKTAPIKKKASAKKPQAKGRAKR